MDFGDVVKPFTMGYEGKDYKVSFLGRRGEKLYFLEVEDIDTGEVKEVQVLDYSEGSGNEHLIGSLEETAAKEFTIALAEEVFKLMAKRGVK